MRSLQHVAVGLVFAILAITFLSKFLTPTTGVAEVKEPVTILVDELNRGIDLNALPIQDVKDAI